MSSPKAFSRIIMVLIITAVFIGEFFAQHYFGAPKEKAIPHWANQTDKIITILETKFPECFTLANKLNISPEMRIIEEADVTGDKIPEAMIWNGCTGAYTTWMVLFQFIGGEPILASFIDENGNKLEPEVFLSGASVMNYTKFGMMSDFHGVYSAMGSASPATCGVDWKVRAFKWDGDSGMFRLNEQFSQKIKQNFPQYFPQYFNPSQGPVSTPVKDCPTSY